MKCQQTLRPNFLLELPQSCAKENFEQATEATGPLIRMRALRLEIV